MAKKTLKDLDVKGKKSTCKSGFQRAYKRWGNYR